MYEAGDTQGVDERGGYEEAGDMSLSNLKGPRVPRNVIKESKK